MAHVLVLPDAPFIADLTFRPLVGAEESDALLAVRQGCTAHDQVDPLSTTEGIPTRDQMSQTVNAAVATNQHDRWLVAQVAERVVGYSRVISWPEEDGTWVYLSLGWLLPSWRGQGIGTAMLHWAESRSRQLAAAEHPGARAELAANASSTEHEAATLLQYEGYAVGYTVLEMGLDVAIPVAATPLVAGIEIRPVVTAHLPRIAASVREAYQDEYKGGRFSEGSDPVAYTAELSAARHDPSLWQVAWARDEVTGQVLTVIEGGRAEVFEVSVRPAWRRCGIGRALLTRAVLALRARGVEIIRLHTVADFPTRARDLYTSIGFRVLKEFPRYRKPLLAATALRGQQ